MKWAKEIIAMANDEVVECRVCSDRSWEPVKFMAQFDYPMYMFRIKPKAIILNGEELPAPVVDGHYDLKIIGVTASKQFVYAQREDRDKVYNAIVKALTV